MALPVETHEGIATVAIPDPGEAGQLVSGSLRATVVRVALPAVASSLLMTLFASVDAFWVGTRIGPPGLAAVSMSLFWIWMIVSLAEMVSIGLTAVAARRHGEGRSAEAARIGGDALLFTCALGLAIAVLGSWSLPRPFAVMHAPAVVATLGVRYLGTYLIGAPLIFGFFAVDAAFRASGDTRTPFVLLLASVAASLLLDPLMILGIGPVPRLGIAGAAIATVSTRGVVFAVGGLLAYRRGLLRFAVPQVSSILAVCRVGLPTALTGVLFSLIYVALTPLTTRFGVPALAALGIGHRVESWLFMVGVGFGAATAAVVGQSLGAHRPDRAAAAGWVAVGWCTALGAVVCVLQLGFAPQFAGMFTTDATVVAEASRYLRIAALAQLAVCAEVVLESALGGAGDTVPPMVASTTITALRIPLAAWSAARWGVVGIWWVISLTACARGLAMAALWRSGRWQRKSV